MIIVPFHIEESEEMELIHFCSYFRDLSGNQLTGAIPNFGSMKWLQTLKLSGNQLSGPSPVFLDGSSSQGLANLTALATL
jgi:Leucine-rich repeat (LRR) protein